MYKQALKLKLRFNTQKGNLSVEDLWDLSLNQLNTIAKNLNRSLKQESEEDFLDEKPEASKIVKLQFDIVLDVLNTKKEEKKAAEMKEENAARKQQLLTLLEKKQLQSLENLSEAELLEKIQAL